MKLDFCVSHDYTQRELLPPPPPLLHPPRKHHRSTTQQPRTYSKTLQKNGCVIIEGAPHENKMAGKGKITSERASS